MDGGAAVARTKDQVKEKFFEPVRRPLRLLSNVADVVDFHSSR
jgi:hypothetical protein